MQPCFVDVFAEPSQWTAAARGGIRQQPIYPARMAFAIFYSA